jgi:hypothetical protein
MRRFLTACLGMLALLALPSIAFAQSGAYCPIGATSPHTLGSSVSTYTLSPADQCGFLNFTDTGGTTITMPNAATTLPAGFRVWIKAQSSGTVTIGTPTTSTIDGVAGPVSITQGTGVEVRSDGTNYFTSGLGIKHP